jgi:hypothetical protein
VGGEDYRTGTAVYRLKALGKCLSNITSVDIMLTISLKLDGSGIVFPKGGNDFQNCFGSDFRCSFRVFNHLSLPDLMEALTSLR